MQGALCRRRGLQLWLGGRAAPPPASLAEAPHYIISTPGIRILKLEELGDALRVGGDDGGEEGVPVKEVG